MSATRFTGERLHEGSKLFALDLARHQAAYEFARETLGSAHPGARVVELGCGSGYGSASLAGSVRNLVAVDRIPPDAEHRRDGLRYLRADLRALPFREGHFDAAISFQVIEHLDDPHPYLRAIATLLREGGCALISTPNRQLSDGVNPYHVREYLSDELGATLREHFAEVEVLGVGMSEPVREILAARSQRIRRIMRLDPLGLHRRLPQSWVERLFAWGALLVRRQAGDSNDPDAGWRDFPIVDADDSRCLDWIARCRAPLAQLAPHS